jgi:phage terminase large subunit-like protein
MTDHDLSLEGFTRRWAANSHRYHGDIKQFLADQWIIRTSGELIDLQPDHAEVLDCWFTRDARGKFPYSTYIMGDIKKSAKTELGAAVGLWFMLTEPGRPEGYALANDLEQANSRSFGAINEVIEANPLLKRNLVVRRHPRPAIVFPDGGHLEALPHDYAGEAGANQAITLWTELWAFHSERSERLWEEFTPVPTRLNSIRWVDSYAGFRDESLLLWKLYEATVLKGRRVHGTLPMWEDVTGTIVCYWGTTPHMPWQTPAYYAQQRAQLRPQTFARLHQNKWDTSRSAFIKADQWDALRKVPVIWPWKHRSLPVYATVDAAHKRDSLAVTLVGYHWLLGLVLLAHRIWTPTEDNPVIPEDTAVPWLEAQERMWNLRSVHYDPAHFETAGYRLQEGMGRRGVDIVEYTQTGDNLLLMGNQLYDAIRFCWLSVYDQAASDLRAHVINARAKESERGFRLTRGKATAKIDGAIALAMGVVAALERGPRDCRLARGLTFI